MMREPKILKEGQLPSTKTTAYTVPTGKAAIISHLSLVNTDSSARTVNVYVKKSGSSSRRIAAKDMSLAAGEHYQLPMALALAAADVVEWDASVADVVDGVISGTEIIAQ